MLAGLEPQTRQADELRLAVAAEYDAMGDSEMAATVLARGPQDNRRYALRASLLAKAENNTALQAYVQLQDDSSNPDPERRLLLGQTAEFLKRMDEALAWYRSVPGGPQRWQARLRRAARVVDVGVIDLDDAERVRADALLISMWGR